MYCTYHFCDIISCIVAVKRKYESERRFFKESNKGDGYKLEKVKKAKYDRRKQRVSFNIVVVYYSL